MVVNTNFHYKLLPDFKPTNQLLSWHSPNSKNTAAVASSGYRIKVFYAMGVQQALILHLFAFRRADNGLYFIHFPSSNKCKIVINNGKKIICTETLQRKQMKDNKLYQSHKQYKD